MEDLSKELGASEFWEKSDYASETYVSEPFTDDILASVEEELGYKLPDAYVELMRRQNGGVPARTSHRTSEATTWAEDHIAITGIFGVGRVKTCSLCGSCGSQSWIDEWGYSPIGVYVADCPSAGHHMLCLDYRACGPQGEPSVVFIDQESDYKITLVAKTFNEFIQGLEPDDILDSSDDVELDDDQVDSAWIDPEFAKELGIEAPEDGCLKKGREGQGNQEEQ